MTKIKEILKNVKCKKCGNESYKHFVLYFIMENRVTKSYISCTSPIGIEEDGELKTCGALFEFDKNSMKTPQDYLLEPHTGKGG